MGLLGDDTARDLRGSLLEQRQLIAIESFPQKDDPKRRVFPEAKLPCTVFVVGGEPFDTYIAIRVHPTQFIEFATDTLYVKPTDIRSLSPENMSIPSCTQRDWQLAVGISANDHIGRLGEVCTAYQGEVNETSDGKKGYIARDPQSGPQVLRGSNIGLYTVREASQGTPMFLRKSKFLDGKPGSIKATHHRDFRVGWQEGSPQNNFRRIIAAMIPQGQFCNHAINYIPKQDCQISLDLLLALLNSKIYDWYFRLTSTNAAVSHYQIYSLPIPSFIEDPTPMNLRANLTNGKWDELVSQLVSACRIPGQLPKSVVYVLEEMSSRIQDIESSRTLTSRADRSHLSPESQLIQDAIDKVLFHSFGLPEVDARYIEERLAEML